jgi:hypothetical protein
MKKINNESDSEDEEMIGLDNDLEKKIGLKRDKKAKRKELLFNVDR